jgi:hypothetical protein
VPKTGTRSIAQCEARHVVLTDAASWPAASETCHWSVGLRSPSSAGRSSRALGRCEAEGVEASTHVADVDIALVVQGPPRRRAGSDEVAGLLGIGGIPVVHDLQSRVVRAEERVTAA